MLDPFREEMPVAQISYLIELMVQSDERINTTLGFPDNKCIPKQVLAISGEENLD